MIIDTVAVTYDSIEELIERQQIIEDRISKYIDEKGIADRYETTVTAGKDNKFYLCIKLVKDSTDD